MFLRHCFFCLFLFIYYELLCLSCGMDSSLHSVSCHPAHRESPHQYHVYRRQHCLCRCICLFHLRAGFLQVSVCVHICVHKCVCVYAICTPECVVFPVRQYVGIAIGWLVSLKGSSGSNGRCFRAAGGVPGDVPQPQRLPSGFPAPSGAWVAGRQLLGLWCRDEMLGRQRWCEEEGYVYVYVCLCLCVFCWGIPSKFVYR